MSDGYKVVQDPREREPASVPEGKKLNKVVGSKPFPPKDTKETKPPDR